jgi:heptosyltransferase II
VTSERILIVRIAALGDIALTSVLLSRIRAERPGAHVTWLCGEAGAPMVRLFDVDEVLTVDESALLRGTPGRRAVVLGPLWVQLIRRGFDRILLVHADRRYRLVILPLAGTPVTALEHGVNPRPGRFRGAEYARLLDHDQTARGPVEMRYGYADIRPRVPGDRRTAGRPLVALVPGGAHNVLRDDALRRWPVQHYRALAERLIAAGCDVLLLGDTRDAATRPHFAHLPCIDRFGTPLLELLADLRDADVLVTHDTGPLQLARLVRTPVVGLFGPTDPHETVGTGSDVDALRGGAHLACRPCYDGRNYAVCNDNVCIQDVSVDSVLDRAGARIAMARREPLPLTSLPA